MYIALVSCFADQVYSILALERPETLTEVEHVQSGGCCTCLLQIHAYGVAYEHCSRHHPLVGCKQAVQAAHQNVGGSMV